MSPEQATALIVAITGLIAALGLIIGQLASMRKQIDGRLTQLLAETKLAAQKDGELAGRDEQRARTEAKIVAEGRSAKPTGR